ncbi:unnamed protein product, partial [Meganyctiphanes norvegica]
NVPEPEARPILPIISPRILEVFRLRSLRPMAPSPAPIIPSLHAPANPPPRHHLITPASIPTPVMPSPHTLANPPPRHLPPTFIPVPFIPATYRDSPSSESESSTPATPPPSEEDEPILLPPGHFTGSIISLPQHLLQPTKMGQPPSLTSSQEDLLLRSPTTSSNSLALPPPLRVPPTITNSPKPPTEELENLSIHLPNCKNHRSRGGHRGGRCINTTPRLSPLFPSAANISSEDKRKRQSLTLSPTNSSSTSSISSPNHKNKSRRIEDLLGAPKSPSKQI